MPSPATIVLSVLYMLALFAALVVFIVYFILLRRQIRGFLKYGFIAAGVLLCTDALVIVMVPEVFKSMALPFLIAVDIVASGRLLLFTTLGIYYSRRLGIASLPVLARHLGENKAAETHTEAGAAATHAFTEGMQGQPFPEAAPGAGSDLNAPGVAGASRDDALEAAGLRLVNPTPASEVRLVPMVTAEEAISFPPRVSLATWICATFGVGAFAVCYTAVLFGLTHPRMSEMAKQMFRVQQMPETIAETFSASAILTMVTFAFAEEVVFRLGIQNYLAHALKLTGARYWNAIVATTAIWTIGHTGVLEPNWVKLVQVFPIGLALGWLYRKCGTESCFLAHAFLNVAGLLMAPSLLS